MYSAAGGYAGTLWRGKSLGNNPTFTGNLGGNNIYINPGNELGWNASSKFTAPSNGIIALFNSTNTDFNRLQFGGTTSSFPSIKKTSGAGTLEIRLADDSGPAAIYANDFRPVGAAQTMGAGQISYGATTQTTVGAAGAASALPAAPLGYIQINVAGTAAKIPYYNN